MSKEHLMTADPSEDDVAPSNSSAASPSPTPEDLEDALDMQLPPADFPMICMIFGTQAMVAMGVIPDPTSSKPKLRLDAARHFIDLLAVLEAKTKGNLTSDEQQLLTSQLHHLRMTFVEKQKQAK